MQMGQIGLPADVTPEMLEDDDFLKLFHHILLEVIPCPRSPHLYPTVAAILINCQG
jgi:hypothetical protein